MYREIEIKNFRLFDHLVIRDLGRINLISGKNNTGKTTLLEAIYLHSGAVLPELTIRISAMRGIEQVTFEPSRTNGSWVDWFWTPLFRNFDPKARPEISAENEAGEKRVMGLRILRDPAEFVAAGSRMGRELGTGGIGLELDPNVNDKDRDHYILILDQNGLRTIPPPPAPPFSIFFLGARSRTSIDEDAERFGRLELIGQQEVVIEALRVIEPRLRRLTVVLSGGQGSLYADMGLPRLIPLAMMGEGMTRLASIVIAIGIASDGVVLIDELENGIHYSVLPDVWRTISRASELFSTQVFATTHSRECIVAAHRVLEQTEPGTFRYYRLERTPAGIQAVSYDDEALEASIELGLEVR